MSMQSLKTYFIFSRPVLQEKKDESTVVYEHCLQIVKDGKKGH